MVLYAVRRYDHGPRICRGGCTHTGDGCDDGRRLDGHGTTCLGLHDIFHLDTGIAHRHLDDQSRLDDPLASFVSRKTVRNILLCLAFYGAQTCPTDSSGDR